jgi:hypothetical protein
MRSLLDASTVVGAGLGALLKILVPVIVWVGIGHYYLNFPLEVTLLAYIAVQITTLCVAQASQVQPPNTPESRDFYVVTDDSYHWDLTLNISRWKVEPQLGGSTQAFDNLEAARLTYQQLEGEHNPLELEGHDLRYHEIFGYDEQETRTWVVFAQSKTQAYDKVWYDESRRRLGHDRRTDHLLLVTDNEKRRQTYREWWRQQRAATQQSQVGP